MFCVIYLFPANEPRRRALPTSPADELCRQKLFPTVQKLFPAVQKLFPAVQKLFPTVQKLFPAVQKLIPQYRIPYRVQYSAQYKVQYKCPCPQKWSDYVRETPI